MGDKYSIFYTLFWGQIQHNYTLQIWGSNAIYFTLYMRDKHNIFYAFFGGQMLYILRSIWGTDAIYFTLDMMDKHNIFYALFDVYSVFKTSGEYYYCNDKIQDNTRKTYVCFNVLISILATFFSVCKNLYLNKHSA